jgi:glycosyltransferase involved in cell wall biosynthesis
MQRDFSIIIPTYNRPLQLRDCLQSLTRLDYARELFEVILVNDGGEVPLDKVISAFCDKLDVSLVTQSHAGPAAARNTGAAQAKGKFLAFTDDDCMPQADWLSRLAARFVETPDQIIGGRTVNALRHNPYSTASQAIVDYVYAYYNTDPHHARFFASNNLAIPADRFSAIGGFDPTFRTSEDRDLCDRWLHHGNQMIYAPEIIVYHAHPLTLRTFWRQHFNYGRGAFRFHRMCVQRGSQAATPEHQFYLNLLWYPVLKKYGHRLPTLLIWQVANTAGFFYESIQSRRQAES